MPVLSRRDVPAIAFLTALILFIFRPIALEGRVLAEFDAEVYFYPNAAYLASSLRQLRLPLWNPDMFAGVPFLANSQVGALYLPNYFYLAGPISSVASYLIVGHLLLFAIAMYVLARASLGLERFGATIAAAVVAAGGLTGGMIGHINQVEALAWAPFTIVLVERGAVRRSWRLAALAAVPLALALFAGHTQVVYMTAAFAGAAGVSRCAQRWGERRLTDKALPPSMDVLRDLGLIAVGPILAAAIAAAQLLPTLELTRASIRSTGLDFADAAAVSLPPPYVLTSLLPTVGQPPSTTEWLAYIPIAAGLLAVVGLRRRPRIERWWLAGVAIVALLLAFGQFTPLFRIAYAVVPGFRLFRVPARWLAIWVMAIALLAGAGADVLTSAGVEMPSAGPWRDKRADPIPWRPLSIALAAPLVGGGLLLAYLYRHVITRPSLATLALWVGSLAVVAITLRLSPPESLARRALLLAAIVLELSIGSGVLPSNDAVWPDAVEAKRETVTYLQSVGASDRVLGIGDNTFDPGNLAAIRASLDDSLPAVAKDTYVTALKHVEGLTPNLPMRFGLSTIDGYDGGVLPLARYHDFKRLFAAQGPDVADGRLRIQLRSVPDTALLSWLNVRWVVIDRLRDHWADGAYYDLSVLQPLANDTPIQLRPAQPFRATSLGVVLRADGATAPVGALRLELGGASVVVRTDQLQSSPFPTDTAIDPKGVWLWTTRLPTSVQADSVTVTWKGQPGTILRGLTAIDDAARSSVPIVVSPSLRLGEMGDMKVYEVTNALPRAFLANGLSVVPTTNDAVARMRQADWHAQDDAVAVASDVKESLAFQAGGPPDDATTLVSQPERIVIRTASTSRRVLVLTDSFYPGWQATVDGAAQPILPVNLLFRGVILSPGPHVVEFSYRPLAWEAGIAISVVGTLALAAILRWSRKRPSEFDAH